MSIESGRSVMTRIARLLANVAFLLAIVTAARTSRAGSVPPYMTEQGRLFDAMGTPIVGSLAFVFTIYPDKSGGNALWSESKQITLDEGYFSTTLGDTTQIPLTVFNGTTRFLGIKVGTDTEMTPRQPLSSVPYALMATNVIGDITPSSIVVGGKTVIDARGQWTGDATGLSGPAGPAGPTGPAGA